MLGAKSLRPFFFSWKKKQEEMKRRHSVAFFSRPAGLMAQARSYVAVNSLNAQITQPQITLQASSRRMRTSLNKGDLALALDNAAKKLGIRQEEDWYSVTLADLRGVGMPALTRIQLVQLLGEKYPHHNWDKVFLLRGRYAQQKKLERAVNSLFEGETIKNNARKELELINPETGDYLEADLYIPSLNLAFEYQDRHHYIDTEYAYQPVETYRMRDNAKKLAANEKGLSLITVPCWWDGTNESLVATIKAVRPDLLPSKPQATESQIPEEMPAEYQQRHTYTVEGIGVPSTACFFTHSKINPKGWWMFEKYDGLRGFWNPNTRLFYSRHGKPFSFPQEVVDTMPTDIFLDGEIWFGRDNFQECTKVAQRMESNAIDWHNFRYMVYDIPNSTYGIYKDRYNRLVEYFSNHPTKYVEVAKVEECESTNRFEKFFQDIIDMGGEGVILRDPNAPYQEGRSAGYLKHKKYRDAEARVVNKISEHQWECELPNGVRFIAVPGTTEFVKRWNPQSGDIVTFKHHGFLLASKKPKMPTIYRVRSDLKWEDVIKNWKEHTIVKKEVERRTQRKKKPTSKPKGYWVQHQNRREFFVNFAAEKGFDPLKSENWDTVTTSQILQKKGGASLLKRYNYNLQIAIRDSFPECTFKIETLRASYWKDIKNCRSFFDDLALKEGIVNPLSPEEWHYWEQKSALSRQPLKKIIRIYGGLISALQSAYSEVPFQEWRKVIQKNALQWRDADRCRSFFDEFANEKGFNPLDVKNWLTLSFKTLRAKQNGSLIGTYNGGFKAALELAYPELQFPWRK